MSIGQNSLQGYLRVIWRWKLLFLAFLIGTPAIAYLIVSRQTKIYNSSVLLQEDAQPVDTSLFTSGTSPTPSAAPTPQTLGGQAREAATPPVAKLAARHLSPRPSNPASLLGYITATSDPNTGFITITAQSSNPKRAAQIANAFGHAVVKFRSQQAVGQLTATINRVDAQLATLGPTNVGRGQLSGQLQRLQALRAAQGNNAQILQAATPSSSPVSPKTTKVVGLGAVVGLLLGIGAVFVAEGADRRIRHPEDVEDLTGVPLLAVVPSEAFSDNAAGGSAGEAFHMLRSALTFFNVDRSLSTVLIASPLKGDGKTTVATHLALAAAQAGRDVILIDADLRRPQASSRLQISGDAIAPGHGLAGVLSGQVSLADALVDVPIANADEKTPAPSELLQGRFRLLPAGGTPPNPSELLASRRMRELSSEVAELAELVVIDTNPLLSVSDSLPLFDSVSGVVLVGRLNHTTKDALKRLQKTIANTNATVLGVVATGAKAGVYGRYGYGSGYGYYEYTSSANGKGNGRSTLIGRLGRPRKTQDTT